MYILELVCKDYEGTWTQAICASISREKLEQHVSVAKQIKAKTHTSAQYLFLIGDLERYFLAQLEGVTGENGVYCYQGKTMPSYLSIKELIIEQGQDYCISLGLDADALRKAVERDFRESLRFMIREIEEI